MIIAIRLLTLLSIIIGLLAQGNGSTEDNLFDVSSTEDSAGEPLSEYEMAIARVHNQFGPQQPHAIPSGAADSFSQQAFEGDISNQGPLLQLLSQSDAVGGRRDAAITEQGAKWDDKIVPYVVSAKFKTMARQLMAQAIDHIQQSSCIQFKPRVNQTDYIYFGINGTGCNADVGRMGSKQEVILASAQCFQGYGVIVHELMHVLGFYHEQARSDRDQFVEILWQNIDPLRDQNFMRYDSFQVDVFQTPYDYDSVMHYPSDAFSSNGEPTIKPKVPSVRIGQRTRLSPIDIFELNVFYACPGDHQMPAASHSPSDIPESTCNSEPYKMSTHDCCDGVLIDRLESFCCAERVWPIVGSANGLRLRHGCCGGVPFFDGVGCCNQVAYNKTTHRCCDDQIESRLVDNVDCDGNPYPVELTVPPVAPTPTTTTAAKKATQPIAGEPICDGGGSSHPGIQQAQQQQICSECKKRCDEVYSVHTTSDDEYEAMSFMDKFFKGYDDQLFGYLPMPPTRRPEALEHYCMSLKMRRMCQNSCDFEFAFDDSDTFFYNYFCVVHKTEFLEHLNNCYTDVNIFRGRKKRATAERRQKRGGVACECPKPHESSGRDTPAPVVESHCATYNCELHCHHNSWGGDYESAGCTPESLEFLRWSSIAFIIEIGTNWANPPITSECVKLLNGTLADFLQHRFYEH